MARMKRDEEMRAEFTAGGVEVKAAPTPEEMAQSSRNRAGGTRDVHRLTTGPSD